MRPIAGNDMSKRRTERKHIAAGHAARHTIGTAGRAAMDGKRGGTMGGKRDEKKTKIGYRGNFESDTLSVTVID